MPSDVLTIMDPTQEQLRQAEDSIDALKPMLDAMYNCKTPNVLYFTHEALTPDFSLQVEHLPSTDLDEAVKFLIGWASRTHNFGQGQVVTELAYSADGHKLVCRDRFKLVLTNPVTLPSGQRIQLRPGHKTRTVYLVNYHYLRIVKADNCYRIAEWRIASQPSDFFQLLDSRA